MQEDQVIFKGLKLNWVLAEQFLNVALHSFWRNDLMLFLMKKTISL